MYNTHYYPYNTPQPMQMGYKVYPVANIEEASTSQVDYQGNPLFFYNKAKGEIYFKKFDTETGLVEFKRFMLSNEPVNQAVSDTKKLEDEIEILKVEIERLYTIIEPKHKKAVEDVK